jgi:peptide deformylase
MYERENDWSSPRSPYESHPLMKNLILVGAQILRETSREVDLDKLSDPLIQNTITIMRDIMLKTDEAIGLSAPQVGVPLRIIAIQYKKEWLPTQPIQYGPLKDIKPYPLTFFINPVLKVVDDSLILGREGCLSIPHYHGFVQRYAQVEARGWDEFGKELYWTSVSNWMSRVLQHETDHLNGVLYIDRLFDKQFRHNLHYNNE